MSRTSVRLHDGNDHPVISEHGDYVVTDLRGSSLKGTIGVFHVGTGKNAVPPRHADAVRSQKSAKAVAEWLNIQHPVDQEGNLLVDRALYHSAFADFVATL